MAKGKAKQLSAWDELVERTTVLWTSWWWFGVISGLLTLELIIRRRQGLP